MKQSRKMLKGKHIIIVGQQPWDLSIGSNCKNIAIEFSKGNRVLYVNAPLDRFTAWRNSNDPAIQKRKQVIQGKQNGLEICAPNLWTLYPDVMIESVNWIGSQNIFEYFNKINNRRFAESIRKAIKQLGFTDYILFNDNDIFRSFHLKEFLQPELSIYYSRDYMLAVDYWRKHGEKLEPLLIAHSDICVANSTYLADYCRQYNPHSYYVGQGCELELFLQYAQQDKQGQQDQPTQQGRTDQYAQQDKQGQQDQSAGHPSIPEDLKAIPGPIIGYVGALAALRLDISILTDIAQNKPAWSIVLVGPEDDAFKASQLHQLPNVYFLGAKAPEALPAYIHAFDVCLNPQVINQVTIGNYPRKIDEYLAMGKPVVATKTDFMATIFSEYTYLGKTGQEYIALIQQALEENSAQKITARKAFASTHTWEKSVNEIYKAIFVYQKSTI